MTAIDEIVPGLALAGVIGAAAGTAAGAAMAK
jgi:hypothetical protein